MSILGSPITAGGGGMLPKINVSGLLSTDSVVGSKDGKTKQGKWVERLTETSNPIMTSNTSPSGNCFAGGACNWDIPDLYQIYSQVGVQSNTAWNIATPNPAWIGYKFENKFCVTSWTICLTLAGSSTYTDGATVILQGSNDGSNYTDIGEAYSVTEFSSNKTISVTNSTYYLYYRIYFNKTPMYNVSQGGGKYDINNMQYIKFDGIEDTSYYQITVDDFGLWSITATSGLKTKTISVNVDTVRAYDVDVIFGEYLYYKGDECETLTGGWVKSYGTYGSSGTFTKNATNIYAKGANSSSGSDCGGRTTNAIDLSGYSKLKVNIVSAAFGTYSSYGKLSISTSTTLNESEVVNILTTGVIEKDISSITSTNYIFVYALGYNSEITFDKVWLEE